MLIFVDIVTSKRHSSLGNLRFFLAFKKILVKFLIMQVIFSRYFGLFCKFYKCFRQKRVFQGFFRFLFSCDLKQSFIFVSQVMRSTASLLLVTPNLIFCNLTFYFLKLKTNSFVKRKATYSPITNAEMAPKM